MNTFRSLVFWILCLFYSLYKYFLHLLTGKCTLLRIIHSTNAKAQKYILIENNIKNSKNLSKINWLEKKSEDEINDDIVKVMKCKKVNDVFQEEFSFYLRNISDIYHSYNGLIGAVVSLKSEKVEIQNKTHKNLLISLWNKLRPGEELSEQFKSKQWTQIGFQGIDPVTDFRGMGLLGLTQLEYFATNLPDDAEKILEHSSDFTVGYPLAISSINLTALVYDLLVSHQLKLFFYSLPASAISLQSFHKLFGVVCVRFHRRWVTERPGVMQFNAFKDRFGARLAIDLNDSTRLGDFIDI